MPATHLNTFLATANRGQRPEIKRSILVLWEKMVVETCTAELDELVTS